MDLLLRNFDNVMTFIINKRIDDELKTEKSWRQFASHHTKSSEKRIRKNIYFTFQKELTREPGLREIKGTCHVVRIIRMSLGFPKKNVTDKCCIDIKTKADKEDEG